MNFKRKRTFSQIKSQKKLLLNDKMDISLTKILGSEECQTIISECREFRDRIYTPLQTIFMFIKQVMHPDKSCKNIVAGTVVERMVAGETPISNNTGPYSKARGRLPEETVATLVKHVGASTVQRAPATLKWKGHEVKAVDGSTLLMPDTKKNQLAFPQHKNQKKGAGFPLARLVVVLSLSVGVVVNYALGPFKGKGSGEASLFRSIIDCVNKDDIVLGDRYYPSFFFFIDLLERGAYGLCRAQGQRHYDFRKGEFLGRKDHIMEWRKPVKPDWMSEEVYQACPDKIKVRELKVNGDVYVTTLLKHKKYHKNELAMLYKMRWQIELTLRNIKSVMKMDMLSCKTPEMVRKEIGMHFLAYNLIRVIIAEACAQTSLHPTHQISFKGTLQLLIQFMPHFLHSAVNKDNNLYKNFLKQVVKNKIGNRSGRMEPRVVKRRRKPFPLLHKQRSVEIARLLRKREKIILKQAA